MYPKNTAVPRPIYAKVVSAADGSPITTGVAIYHLQGTTRAAAVGDSPTHLANGIWAYTPTEAETNYDTFGIEFQHADAVGDGAVVQVVTTLFGTAQSNMPLVCIGATYDAIDPIGGASALRNLLIHYDTYGGVVVGVHTSGARGDISYAVWDEPTAGHATAGTFAVNLDAKVSERLPTTSYTAPPTAASIADAVWDEATAGHATTGTFALNLDAAVSTRAPSATALSNVTWTDTKAGYLDAPVSESGSGLTAQQVRDAMKLAPTVGTPADGSVDAHLDTVVASTASIGSASITYSGPIGQDGEIEVRQGDDYRERSGTGLRWTLGAGFPSLSGATLYFDLANARTNTQVLATTATGVSVGGQTQIVAVELDDVQTSTFPAGTNILRYQLWALLSTGDKTTLSAGSVTVRRDI